MSILKGFIYLVSNPDFICNLDLNQKNIKVVSLDEDNILQDDRFIGGTCLLPPIECKVAEVDNDEARYDQFYQSHLLDPYQMQFLSALLAYLYKGGTLFLFLPDTGYNNTRFKLVQQLWIVYGIRVGQVESTNPQDQGCFYDDRCSVMWLNMIYSLCNMPAQEYLYMLPDDAVITPAWNPSALNILMNQLRPVGGSINERVAAIERYRKLLKKNPNTKIGLMSIY